EWMLDTTAPQPGERVLDLGSGPGGLGLLAARRLASGGEVVLSDVAPEMTEVAAARAEALGLHNVRTRVLDLEQIDEPDASYDVVLSRDGFQFATLPGRAANEVRRVLRPGGRVALATWGPRDRNPWLGVVFDTVSEQLGVTLPPPGVPGPFSLDNADRIADVLTSAGLAQAAVRAMDVPRRVASFEEWWSRTKALAGPLSALLASLPTDVIDELRVRVARAVEPFRGAQGFDFPGVALLTSARRAA